MPRRKDAEPEPGHHGSAPDELVSLTQILTVEGQRIAHAFAHRQGMHGTDVEALVRILVAGDKGTFLTAGDVAHQLGLATSSVTSLLDRLERAGHIERVRDPRDRRRVTIRYAASGLRIAQEFFSPLGQLHHGVTSQFSGEELETVRRYLAATVEAMRHYRAHLLEPDVPTTEA